MANTIRYKGRIGRNSNIKISQSGNGRKLVKVRVLGRTKVRVA